MFNALSVINNPQRKHLWWCSDYILVNAVHETGLRKSLPEDKVCLCVCICCFAERVRQWFIHEIQAAPRALKCDMTFSFGRETEVCNLRAIHYIYYICKRLFFLSYHLFFSPSLASLSSETISTSFAEWARLCNECVRRCSGCVFSASLLFALMPERQRSSYTGVPHYAGAFSSSPFFPPSSFFPLPSSSPWLFLVSS